MKKIQKIKKMWKDRLSFRTSVIGGLSLILPVIFVASCDENLNNPYLRINPFESVQFSNDGGKSTVEVTTNIDDWTFSVDHDWLTVTETSSGIELTVEPNQENAERKTFLRVIAGKYSAENKTMVVIQKSTFLTVKPEVIPQLDGVGDIFEVVVNSNAEDWSFVLEEVDWLTAVKTTTGIRLTAENNTGKLPRSATLHILSEKYNQEKILTVTQGISFIPYIDIFPDTDLSAPIAKSGAVIEVTVDTNVDEWSFTIDEEWLTSQKTSTGFRLIAGKYYADLRTATLTVSSVAYPELTQQWQISQEGGYTVKNNILTEDFNWLPATYGNKIIYNTTPAETRYSAWTQAERDRGWTGTPVLDEGAPPATQIWVYAREGYIKLGKTRVSSDLISPKLTGIQGTKDVRVEFKAIGYQTAAGVKDIGNELNISVIGPGTVSTQQFKVEYFKNAEEGGATYIWQDDPPNEYSFTITGATAETQIRWLAGPTLGVLTGLLGGNDNNRIGIDDVKVDVIE